ncbi:hypothetical protein ABDK56_11165 [Sphingomonas sp. ASV193]|uniref:hypothetical protein n=1 Tax=Sphingomonas sp. ASV193 TaxID=3144405 RepID=UPI0032E882C6
MTPIDRQGMAAASRARWLAELDQALAESERLAETLAADPAHAADLATLSANIVRLRAEVEQLRRGLRWKGETFHPKRTRKPAKGPQTPSGRSPPPEKG